MDKDDKANRAKQRDVLKRKLIGILGLGPELVSPILDKHPDDVNKLYVLLQGMEDEVNRQWVEPVLASLPPNEWEFGPLESFMRVKPKYGGSMRFLARTAFPGVREKQLTEARRSLLAKLTDSLSGEEKVAYRPMLQWTKSKEHPFFRFDSQPLAADSYVGLNLCVLEDIFNAELSGHERDWVLETGACLTQTIPAQITREFAAETLSDCYDLVLKWLNDEESLSDTVPESLFARVSVNISVNRAILEIAASDQQGLRASEMVVAFLTVMNRCGIETIPEEALYATEENIGEVISKIFNNWFSHNGDLVLRDSHFTRPMSNRDIKWIVDWSHQLQEMYVTGRGRSGDWICDETEELALSKHIHAGPRNRFLFALAMAGAFYEKSRVGREVRGDKTSDYAVFPAPEKGDADAPLSPPPHAAEFLQQAYGQMYFGNEDDYIRVGNVREYATTTSAKRACKQMLLHFAVKNRSSRQLLALNRNIEKYIRKCRGLSE